MPPHQRLHTLRCCRHAQSWVMRVRTVQSAASKQQYRPRSLFWSAVLLATFWTLLFGYSIHAAMPFNPVALPYEQLLQVRFWLPQGWQFYTKNPRDERLLLLATDGSPLPEVSWPMAAKSNWFGIKRTARAIGVEAGALFVQIPETAWRECRRSEWSTCIKGLQPVTVENPTPRPRLCGTVIFGRQAPVPWAWSRTVDNRGTTVRLARVNVECRSDSE